MTFIVIPAHPPRPDAAAWSGRRALAVLDAVAWPALWVMAVTKLPPHSGLLGMVVVALAIFFGLKRARRALYENHRYFFTTLRWAKVLATLWLLGLCLQLAVWLTR